MTRTGPHPLLRFLPWLLLSVAAHSLLLVQWSPAGAPAAAANDTARTTPVQVQLLRRAEPARVASEQAARSIAATVDAEDSVRATPVVAAAALPVTPPARSTVPRTRPHTTPSDRAQAQVDAAQTTATTAAHATRTDAADPDSEAVRASAGWAELMSLLHAAIDRHKRYPQSALHMGREGSARVDFRLQPDGRIDDLNIGVSSGERALDLAAYRAVRAIAPFTDADRYLDRAQRFQVDVVFRIN